MTEPDWLTDDSPWKLHCGCPQCRAGEVDRLMAEIMAEADFPVLHLRRFNWLVQGRWPGDHHIPIYVDADNPYLLPWMEPGWCPQLALEGRQP